MKKLWQKNWKLHPVIEAFETKDDLVVDQKLVPADIAGSLAHAIGLASIGLLDSMELKKTKIGLAEILKLEKEGKFALTLGDEDVHTKIENYLTQHHGEIGKKIHTGRSRNDQVATAIRLFTKNALIQIALDALDLAEAFVLFAQNHTWLPMPGYTHMQKAMPSSIGMWAASFAQNLLDDLEILKGALAIVDQSPLGSAAGYGAPLPLKRADTAKLLGFEAVQNNSLACQNSRGKMEMAVIGALVHILLTINKFASDVMLFTTSEFGLFTVADELTTGSSIMPQKKNVDVAELLRSKSHLVLGNLVSVASLTMNLPSGYNRDFQDLKKPLIESLAVTSECLLVTKILLTHLMPNTETLLGAMTPELFATHAALTKVAASIPFRDAYGLVAKKLSQLTPLPHNKVVAVLKQSIHEGGTGNLGLPQLKTAIMKEKSIIEQKVRLKEVIQQLL